MGKVSFVAPGVIAISSLEHIAQALDLMEGRHVPGVRKKHPTLGLRHRDHA